MRDELHAGRWMRSRRARQPTPSDAEPTAPAHQKAGEFAEQDCWNCLLRPHVNDREAGRSGRSCGRMWSPNTRAKTRRVRADEGGIHRRIQLAGRHPARDLGVALADSRGSCGPPAGRASSRSPWRCAARCDRRPRARCRRGSAPAAPRRYAPRRPGSRGWPHPLGIDHQLRPSCRPAGPGRNPARSSRPGRSPARRRNG